MLGALPEALQRSLYSAFQLQVRYHRPRHEVTIRVTIRADALPTLTQIVKEAAGTTDTQVNAAKPAAIVPMFWAPPAGFEPAHTAPEATSTCSADLHGSPLREAGGRLGRNSRVHTGQESDQPDLYF